MTHETPVGHPYPTPFRLPLDVSGWLRTLHTVSHAGGHSSQSLDRLRPLLRLVDAEEAAFRFISSFPSLPLLLPIRPPRDSDRFVPLGPPFLPLSLSFSSPPFVETPLART